MMYAALFFHVCGRRCDGHFVRFAVDVVERQAIYSVQLNGNLYEVCDMDGDKVLNELIASP